MLNIESDVVLPSLETQMKVKKGSDKIDKNDKNDKNEKNEDADGGHEKEDNKILSSH